MARHKKYNETEVLEKALNLFWINGYEATSVRMLEKEMGINQFSIYSSFESKEGVFDESILLYIKKLNRILEKAKQSNNGIEDIKQYFYDFVIFSKENNLKRGCLIVNSISELGEKINPLIMKEMLNFTKSRNEFFISKLPFSENIEIRAKQANFLSVILTGLAVSCKIYNMNQIEEVIETTFNNLKLLAN